MGPCVLRIPGQDLVHEAAGLGGGELARVRGEEGVEAFGVGAPGRGEPFRGRCGALLRECESG
ncbi:MAG: hypothetical protein AB1726_18205 [Planctomycetota bacterium]